MIVGSEALMENRPGSVVENCVVHEGSANSLKLQGVSKAFGEVVALHDATFDARAGSFTAILGPSGCGKTTLLRIVAGFESPDAGAVHLGGQLVAGNGVFHEPEHRSVGIVPQEAALFPHLTVQDNVGFGLPRAERRGQRVSDLLELVGLGGLARRKPHELSGGQQQRVALARCLATKPRVVLLDEPFSALDAALRIELRMETRRLLSETGTTTVLVTHDQDEALSLADHVALMNNGRIVQFATPGELYSLPQSAWAASFVGDANLLPVDTQGFGQDTVASSIGELRVRSDFRQTTGGSAVALLRPEQLGLVSTGGLNATIMDVVFHGHDHLVSVITTDTLTPLVVRAPAYLSPVRGETVQVAITGAALLLDVSMLRGGFVRDSRRTTASLRDCHGERSDYGWGNRRACGASVGGYCGLAGAGSVDVHAIRRQSERDRSSASAGSRCAVCWYCYWQVATGVESVEDAVTQEHRRYLQGARWSGASISCCSNVSTRRGALNRRICMCTNGLGGGSLAYSRADA